ncbi:MAG: class I SAM-dependent methyltransferase [candidate division WS1 bacterium]|jgi:16S rRNA G966 N2-methylase RsmD|nr:class I SAM-dependent methyltransferase [candidate division WS1 bacterium]
MTDLPYVVTTSRRLDPELVARAQQWAERLGAPYVPRDDRSLTKLCAAEGVEAALTVTPLRVGLVVPAEDVEYFFHPSMARTRVRNIRDGMGDPMVRAMQLQPGDSVLDCTMGRAVDATVASSVVGEQGSVVGYEAHPLVAALTIEGLQSYEIEGLGVQEAMRRIDARHGDCREVLPTLEARSFDIVYFDPFFQHTVEQSQAMQPLRRLGLHEPIPAATYEEARRVAKRAVVIKRRREQDAPQLPAAARVVSGGGSRIEYVVLGPVGRDEPADPGQG